MIFFLGRIQPLPLFWFSENQAADTKNTGNTDILTIIVIDKNCKTLHAVKAI